MLLSILKIVERRELNFFIKNIHFPAHFAGPWNLLPTAAVPPPSPATPLFVATASVIF